MQKKYLFIPFILYILLLVIIYIQIHTYSINQAQIRIEEFLENYKALRTYVSKYQKSEIFKLQSNDIIDKDFFTPNLLSSTFASRTVNKIYNENRLKKNKIPIIIKFASGNPRNLLNKATKKELELLVKYNKRVLSKSYTELIKKDNSTFLHYVVPTKLNQKKCMKCHSNPSLAPKDLLQKYGKKNGFFEKVGDMRAILTTTMNIDSYLSEAKKNFMIVALFITIIFMMILFIVYKFTKKLEKESETTKLILDSQTNLVILTNGSDITDANYSFLNFLNFQDLNSFIKKYSCICELFIDKENYYSNRLLSKDENWIDFMLKLKNDKKIVAIYDKNNIVQIFMVSFTPFGNKNHSFVISFTNITELHNLKNNLENIVVDKTKKLKDINDTLELKVIEKTKEQNILLSLFDKGESVLFKWTNDKDWSVEYVSSSIKKLLNYDKDDFLNNKIPYISCIYKDDLEAVISEVTMASSTNKSFFKHQPYRIVTKDGDIKWILDYTIIVRDSNDNITHYIGYLNDITEVKEQETRLFEQEKMVQMGELMSNIAHHWRQPLSVISTAASGMQFQKKFDTLSDDTFNESCENIIKSTQFLSTTINTFTNFIQETDEQIEIILQDRIDIVLNIVEITLKDENIKLKNSINYDEPIKMTIIPTELSQVLVNIINNAKDILVQRDIENKSIEISLEKINKKVIIIIEDNAGGIADDILPKIFDPYFTTKHKSQGTGLGLHLSQKIIKENYNGSLYAKNTDNGVKFMIELPFD